MTEMNVKLHSSYLIYVGRDDCISGIGEYSICC